jgi:hypothetical protein
MARQLVHVSAHNDDDMLRAAGVCWVLLRCCAGRAGGLGMLCLLHMAALRQDELCASQD